MNKVLHLLSSCDIKTAIEIALLIGYSTLVSIQLLCHSVLCLKHDINITEVN